MKFTEIYEKKKENKSLSKEEIDFFVKKSQNSDISNKQIVSFLQLINENNFSYEETYYLADSLANTGKVLKFNLKQKIVDKHSAGTISDPTTLIFMSVLAALNVKTIKGLSVDYGDFRNSAERLLSIKNFSAKLCQRDIEEKLKNINMAVFEQSNLSPVDKKFYKLCKDNQIVSVPVIAASILCKKIASGANVVVFDVKTGEGSLFKNNKLCDKLAEYLVNSAKLAGISAASVVSSLDQPLGASLGNKEELQEVNAALTSMSKLYDANLLDVARELVIVALMLTKKCTRRSEAAELFDDAMSSGKAIEKFKQFIAAFGGDVESAFTRYGVLDGVTHSYVLAKDSGYLDNIVLEGIKDSYYNLLQVKRRKKDLNAGMEIMMWEGTKVNVGDKLARITFSLDNPKFAKSKQMLENSFIISKSKPPKKNILHKIIV